MSKEPVARHASRVNKELKVAYPEALCALVHQNPFELLAATILSAQCTDKRVNLVTPALFAAYPTSEKMAQAPLERLEGLVKTTGFFRAKAKNLRGMAEMLCAKHQGRVPQTLAELIVLPGVARKTANVVLGVSFAQAEGVVVDTHVARVSARLGLTSGKSPVHIERDLMRLIPQKDWIGFSHRIIAHGRAVCDARRPKCSLCPLGRICPSHNHV